MTNLKRINQFEPWFDEEEKKLLNLVIDSGWIQEGKLARKFEKTFAEFVGSKYAVTTTSGTSALFIALLSLGIGRGDRVIVPDYTAIGTLNAASMTGASVDIVDVKMTDANIDPKKIKNAITSKTKAIIPVHINGRPVDMKLIKEIAKKHNIHIVEDAAQCLGSRQNGKHLGTFSDVGCFSLATSKIITTGQGGVITTSSKKLYYKLVELKDQGTTARLKTTSIPDWYPSIGFNFKFTDLQGAVGLAQFKKLSSRIKRRIEMHNLYLDLLDHIVDFIPTEIHKGVLPWYDDILTKSAYQRANIMLHLKKNKIYTRKFYRPMHSQPAYKREGKYENSNTLSKIGMWLPSSTFLRDTEITFISNKIKQAVKN